VNRVNWLRAKARSDRWNEELLLCRLEMTWTINAFAHRKTFWTDLKTGSDHTTGSQAYAAKQEAMWERMRDSAQQSFDAARLSIFGTSDVYI
jgi:hypothetical protein